MTESWIAALVFLGLAAVVGPTLLVAARLLRVRARASTPLKGETYECGEQAEGNAWVRFHPRYYVVALFFVLFDVEAAFLFPWGVSLRAVGGTAVVLMAVFVLLLLLGWWYAVRKEALKWQ